MKTSAQWWNEVKNDPAKLEDWLKRQYRGEIRAAKRLYEVIQAFPEHVAYHTALGKVAGDEQQHAHWIRECLENRGIMADADEANSEKRYWSTVDLSFKDFATTMAVGAHAEKMRLERIRVIATDDTAPWDLKETFMKILRDELWHERVFREMSTAEALANTAADHEEGKRLLGLEA